MPSKDLSSILLRSEECAFVVPKEPARDHFVMGSDGHTVYRLDKPSQVSVPVGAYETEDDLSERVFALVAAAALHGGEDGWLKCTNINQAVSFLLRYMKEQGLTLAGVVLASSLAHALESRLVDEALRLGIKDFRVFESPLDIGDAILGVCAAKDLGYLVVLPTEADGLLLRGLSLHNPLGVLGVQYILN